MINGYQNPIIEILDTDYTSIETINLELTNQDGLIEKPIFYSTERIRKNGEYKVKNKGFRMTYKLNYSDYSSEVSFTKIISIINYLLSNKLIRLYPHSDVLGKSEIVVCTNKDLQDIYFKLISMDRTALFAWEGITLNFTGASLRTRIDIYRTEDIPHVFSYYPVKNYYTT